MIVRVAHDGAPAASRKATPLSGDEPTGDRRNRTWSRMTAAT